jgi:hypothetical protein
MKERTRVAITVRVSPETHDGLKHWADEEDRSLARQVIRILEEALRARREARRRHPQEEER